MDSINQGNLFLLALGVINFLVVLLYAFEYKKNRRTQSQYTDLVNTNKALLAQSEQTLATHRALLEALTKATKGFETVEGADSIARHILDTAQTQADAIAQSSTKLAEELEQTFSQKEHENLEKIDQIITKTIKDSQEVLENNGALKTEVDKQMQTLFTETLTQSKALITQKNDEFIAEYKTAMAEISKQYINTLQSTNKDIETEFAEKSQAYLNEMKDRLLELSSQKRDVIETEMKKIQAELTMYKTDQMTKIESNIYEILARAAESVIGQAVNFDVHQELIIKALEQARRESMFI